MSISDNRNAFLGEIQKHGAAAKLVAVSKKQPDERLEEALKCGQRIFGENRVQEAYEHWGARRDAYPDLELHLIGPLQTNKVRDAVALFDVIQTLDREKLARALAKEIEEQEKQITCFIQVNTGAEEQKSGISVAELPEFLSYCRNECDLNVYGLMCIPPFNEPASLHFALLQKLAKDHNLEGLSMGMSGDYRNALCLGATHIRVGSGFFGARTS